MGQHQRWTAGLSDDVGHRERLARTRRPKQSLITLSTIDAFHQLLDRRRLVAFREIRAVRS